MAWENKLTLAGVETAILDAAERGVMLATEHVLGESTKIVPIEEGTLGRSGRASVDASGTSITGTISYDTPYAARQHEDLRYRHDKGRTAKYLERPLVAERKTVAAIVATSLRQATR